jgi:hypothetical protein
MAKKKAKAPRSAGVAEKAKLLREYGFNVSYGTKGKRGKVKKSPQAAGAVTRKWKTVAQYVENTKQDFVFQAASGADLAAIARGLSPKQVTPGGFFIRKPRGAKKAPKYKVRPDGTIEYKATGSKGGRVTEEIHPIDPELLAEDPPRAITRLLSKAEAKKAKIVLTVNGWDSSKTKEYSLDALAFYIAQDLLPKFLDPNLDPAYAKAHGHKGGTIEDFCEVFHVKIIKHDGKPAAKKRKPTKRAGRNRR